jgi:hypothetical protein
VVDEPASDGVVLPMDAATLRGSAGSGHGVTFVQLTIRDPNGATGTEWWDWGETEWSTSQARQPHLQRGLTGRAC